MTLTTLLTVILMQATPFVPATPLPTDMATAENKVLGAETCGSVTCHDATSPWPNSAVRQTEYPEWREKDPHAQSYQTLKSERARTITDNLGIGAATEDATCLGCHSFVVPEEAQTAGYHIEEGITCEACHGPGSSWIGVHTAGLFFAEQNVTAGMFPTTSATARSDLCMDCHIGTPERLVTHQMMAAGHPRPIFEINFYTWFSSQGLDDGDGYAHFTVDDDYRQRKGFPYGLRVWAIGQTRQAERTLDLVSSNALFGGMFPEFAVFECGSCHRTVDRNSQGTTNLGAPQVSDANLYFLSLVARIVDPARARELERKITRVQTASKESFGDLSGAARSLHTSVIDLVGAVDEHDFTIDDSRNVIGAIVRDLTQGGGKDQQTTEQALLALGSMVDELHRRRAINAEAFNRAESFLNVALLRSKNGYAVDRRALVDAMMPIALDDRSVGETL